MKKFAKIVTCAALALSCMASVACAEFKADKSITVISREEGSGTRGAFVELTGVEQKIDGKKVDMTTEDAQITNNTSAMLMTVEGDEQAIGYVSLGSLNEKVKAVKVEDVEATAENVSNGTYKIARPFNIAFKADGQSDLSKDFIAYIMSEEGQTIINEHGYVGSNDAAAYEGNGAEGQAGCRRFLFCVTCHGEADRGLQGGQPEGGYRASDDGFHDRHDCRDRRHL